jgi:hypothetical protein
MMSKPISPQVQKLFDEIVALPHHERLTLCASVMKARPDMLYTIVYPILERTVTEIGAARLFAGKR